MRLLEALAIAFINTFGITQPTARKRRQAAWFIFGLLLLAAGVIATIATFLVKILRG